MSDLTQKFLKFGSVGVVNTTVGILLLYAGLQVLKLPLYPVNVGVWVITVFISYVLNSRYNYKARFKFSDLARFYASYLSGLVFGLTIIFIIDTLDTGLSDFVISVAVIIPRFILVFFVVNKFAYKQ